MFQFFRYIIKIWKNFLQYDNCKILFRSMIRVREKRTRSLEFLYYISLHYIILYLSDHSTLVNERKNILRILQECTAIRCID